MTVYRGFNQREAVPVPALNSRWRRRHDEAVDEVVAVRPSEDGRDLLVWYVTRWPEDDHPAVGGCDVEWFYDTRCELTTPR